MRRQRGRQNPSTPLWLPAEPRTRKRELAALGEAMAELGVKTATLVARNEDERIETDAGAIAVVPAWKFLLDVPEAGV